MKKIINIISKARLLTMMVVAVAALAACSDDDDNIVREGLTQNGITVESVTVSALSFSWEAVDNVSQYGYRLMTTDSTAVDGGVTTGRTASFTGLDDDTEYIFEVTPFATYNDRQYKNGAAKCINTKTDKIIPLDTPTLTSVVNDDKVTVSWDAVENAEQYYVKVVDSNDSIINDTITATSYKFTGTVGLTYSVSVSADTEEEAYSQSEWATVDNLVPTESQKKELWRSTATFNDGALQYGSWDATLVAYNDGSYKLLSWYGSEGYDLEFSFDSAGNITVLNGGTPYGDYIPVDIFAGYYIYIYTGAGYNSIDLTNGIINIYCYYSSTYCGTCTLTFDPKAWSVKGTLTESSQATDYTSGNGLTRTLIAYKDGSYKITDWLGNEGFDLCFAPQDDGTLKLIGDTYTDYGYCVAVPFYYDDEYGYWPLYLYNTSGYWGLETDTDDCEFWIQSYYYSYGYVQFKWNKSDVTNY